MGAIAPWHIILVVIVIAVVFGGRGKLSSIMGDAAKGVKAFKDGLKDDSTEAKEAKGEALPRTDKEKDQLNS